MDRTTNLLKKPGRITVILAVLFFGLTFQGSAQTLNNSEKHRMIVLTDIEADPDDTQTLVRLVLY